MAKKKASKKVAKKKVDATKQADVASASSLGPSSLIPSILVVIAAVVVGGLHLNRGGSDVGLPEATNADGDSPKPNDTLQFDSKPKAVLTHEISIADHHTIQPELGDLTLKPRRVRDDAPSAAPTPIPTNAEEDAAAKKQRRDLMTYLQYDDGYAACLTKNSAGEKDDFGVLALKRIKYEFLQKVANKSEFWVAHLPPNAQRLGSAELKSSADKLLSMCRLLTLTHEDYGGRAHKVLKDFMAKDSFEEFSVKSQGPASDYRTAVCLHRLTDAEYAKRAATKEEKLTKAALGALRNAWVENIQDLKQEAISVPPKPMPEGWTEVREEGNGHTYYVNNKTGKSYWIRPVPLYGAKGVVKDPPPPNKDGHARLGSVIARKKPCPFEDTLGIIEG